MVSDVSKAPEFIRFVHDSLRKDNLFSGSEISSNLSDGPRDLRMSKCVCQSPVDFLTMDRDSRAKRPKNRVVRG